MWGCKFWKKKKAIAISYPIGIEYLCILTFVVVVVVIVLLYFPQLYNSYYLLPFPTTFFFVFLFRGRKSCRYLSANIIYDDDVIGTIPHKLPHSHSVSLATLIHTQKGHTRRGHYLRLLIALSHYFPYDQFLCSCTKNSNSYCPKGYASLMLIKYHPFMAKE